MQARSKDLDLLMQLSTTVDLIKLTVDGSHNKRSKSLDLAFISPWDKGCQRRGGVSSLVVKGAHLDCERHGFESHLALHFSLAN